MSINNLNYKVEGQEQWSEQLFGGKTVFYWICTNFSLVLFSFSPIAK